MNSADCDISTISDSIFINTTPEHVFEILTRQKHISNWWTSDVKGDLSSEGSIAEIGFYEGKIVTKYRVEDLKPVEFLIWLCLDGPKELAGSKIEYKIIPSGKKIKLEMNHSDLNGDKDFFDHGTQSWKHVLDSIKLHAETGVGDPISTK